MIQKLQAEGKVSTWVTGELANKIRERVSSSSAKVLLELTIVKGVEKPNCIGVKIRLSTPGTLITTPDGHRREFEDVSFINACPP
jgi:hypothetical protein